MIAIATTAAVGRLRPAERRLIGGLTGLALSVLLGGVAAALLVVLTRGGALDLAPDLGYRLLTLHGVGVFFYWLYLAQSVLMLVFAAAERERPAIAWFGAAAAGAIAMTAGLGLSLFGAFAGEPLLYDGSPEVAGPDPRAAGVFYLGYLALGAGLALTAASAIATLLAAKRERGGAPWSSVGFGTAAWAGLIGVSAIGFMTTFLPAAEWAFGGEAFPADHGSRWHVLFHNLHYLPLMGTVLIWYVLVRELASVTSLFGERFSKLVFALYLLFVPPTSLYHMFLEPDLAEGVRVLGSLLSLFIGVPTVAMFLIVAVSLEATARAAGLTGRLRWLRILPWRDPATAALGAAVVNLAIGGVFSFVLIQEQLAPLLSDTFFVPAYFHFLAAGTVTLTFLAMLGRVVIGLGGAPAWAGLRCALPWALSLGLLAFGAAGLAAGLNGMPRRILEPTYDGAGPAAWGDLSVVIAAGGTLMALAVLAYGVALLVGLWRRAEERASDRVFAAPRGPTPMGRDGAEAQAAWSGPVAVALLLVGIGVATWGAFALMRALPLLASGGGAH